MPFDERGLNTLSTAAGFTLWHYRTNDTRASVIAPGYFSAAERRLAFGDVIIVQAADATAFLPVGLAATAGAGLTLAAFGPGISLLRSATQPIAVGQSGTLTARAIIPGALPPSALPNSAITVTIVAIGPIAQVALNLINGNNQPDAAPRILTLVGGTVTTTVTIPGPAGTQWRLVVADVADPTLVVVSSPTTVSSFARILTEAGGRLLLEDGASLLS